MNPSIETPAKLRLWKNSCLRRPKNPSAAALSGEQPFALIERVRLCSLQIVYGQINVYGVTTKSERHKRSYWTRTADGNGIGGRKAPVPYGS